MPERRHRRVAAVLWKIRRRPPAPPPSGCATAPTAPGPSPNQIDVLACFAPLTGRVLSLWKSDGLALAIDPTTLSDKLAVVVAGAVYRGCAIPVAWVVMPGNKPGGWIDPAVELLGLLSVAIPSRMNLIVMADRGLRSPKLWKAIRSLGWHPRMRQTLSAVFCPDGGTRTRARAWFALPTAPSSGGERRS